MGIAIWGIGVVAGLLAACSVQKQPGGAGNNEAGEANAPAGPAGGNSSGACHAAPDATPALPQPTQLDATQVARAAAVVGSCWPDDGVARSAAHIWLEHLAAGRLYFRMGAQIACLAKADCGCAALEHCLGTSFARAASDCESSRCEGDVFIGCGDGAEYRIDCGRFGLGCDPEGNCVERGAVSCDEQQGSSCTPQGDVTFCDDGATRLTPCQKLGYACHDGACGDGNAGCAAEPSFDQPELLSFTGTACTGKTLSACLGTSLTHLDCSTQGPDFSCQTNGNLHFCGLASECAPADNYNAAQPASCNGSVLTFCNAGRIEHLDCSELGFVGCDVTPKLGHYGCIPGSNLPG